jgi:dnd system-associated protein 4
MAIYKNMKIRIKRNSTQQEIMQKLTSGYKVFDSYRDILILSAIIGFNNGKHIPIEKAASDGVLMQFFTESDYDLMDLLAYAHTKEQSILKNDFKYEIFASYANGGFPILLEVLQISKDLEIDESMQESILTKLYAKLLGNQFKIDTDLISEDIFLS